ncbi:MAG TPA: extracellular solute-binding protein [Candidatus Saccharimonadales bacterium]|nr:extracellular solute-binding protein [Candidatus Saccharimonadales bacterium]
MIGSLGQSISLFFLAVLGIVVSARQSIGATVEETLTALNAKPVEERQRVLIENARKEGNVNFYAATNMRDTQEIVAGFNKVYPFVKVGITSLGGPGVLNKVTTEERAGVALVDVVTMTGGYVPELIEKKMLAKYRSPMVPFVRKGFVDAEGYWPGVYAIGYTIIYNNKRVSQKDLPKRYEDLLQPRWKNNLLMDAEAHDLLAGLIDLWGEAKATSFLRQIAQEQKVTFSRQSHTFMTQLVATGEHDVIVDGYVHNAVALKEKGAPIDYVMMNPTIVRPPSIIAILARAPHPYASALFLDYHLSKEASEIMVKSQGRWAPRKDVPWTVEPQGDVHVVPALQWGPNMRKLVALFNKSIGQ